MEPKAPIAKLPVQLLALVLQHVDAGARLRCCATVCTAWRTAAVLATHSIVVPRASKQQCAALSEWLEAHAAAAPVESINVQSYGLNPSTLRLPADQLPLLRALDLGGVSVFWTHAQFDEPVSSQQPPELPAELSSRLTHLSLIDCPLKLTRLRDFQQLQHLALLEGHHNPDAASSSDCEALAAAMPRLQHLTQLVLQRSWAADADLSAVHHFPRLLVLDVKHRSCTAASQALPATLTKLVIAQCPVLVCGPSTTPSLTQLTALQWLEVSGIEEFDAAALVNSKQLYHLCLGCLKLRNDPEAGQGPQLSVLQHMTRLQHLELPSHENSPDSLAGATEHDFAALTASRQLTHLDISIIADLEHKWGFKHMFPGQGRQLPHLRMLVASMCLLESADGLSGLVACAPHLERIDLSTDGEHEDDTDHTLQLDGEEGPYVHQIGILGGLSRLTQLDLNMEGRRIYHCYWRALARLTDLKSLDLTQANYKYLGGVVTLTTCQQLTYLCVDDGDSWPCLALETPAGSDPDVWQRLAGEGLTAALRFHEDTSTPPSDAVPSLAVAAAEHSLHVEATCEQLRQELTDLRAHCQQVEARCEVLQEEVVDLRAMVLGMFALLGQQMAQ